MPGLSGRLRPPASKSKAKIPTVSIPSHGSPPTSRPSSRVHQRNKHAPDRLQLNATSDKATTALIRRVLCPNASGHGGLDRGSPRPLEELLPPLTSMNEVDLQLYALMAVVMKEFVHSWYSKITPDTLFTEEVVQLIAHCTRALEQRLRRVDVETLLFDEIPSLLEAHIIAYRTARESSARAEDSSRRLRVVYHTLHPHPALSPAPGPGDEDGAKQREAEKIYRQLLAHGAMAVLLPTEDLQNVCLRTLVGDILADLLLGGAVSGKVSEGWFIWDAISKTLASLNQKSQSDGVEHDHSGNLEKGDPEPDQERSSNFGSYSTQRSQSVLLSTLFNLMQYCYIAYVASRFVALGLFRVSSSSPSTTATSSPAYASNSINSKEATPSRSKGNIVRLPVLGYRIFSVISQLLDIPGRMPWLGGILALVHHLLLTGPGKIGTADGVIDRFLRDCIRKYLLTATILPSLLLAIRTTVFPINGRASLTRVSGISAATQHQQPSTPGSDAEIGTFASSGSNTDGQNRIQTSSSNALQETQASLNTASPRASVVDASSSGSEQQSAAEVKAIKRACAASILALIPRRIALTLFAIHQTDRNSFSEAASITAKDKPDPFVQSSVPESSVNSRIDSPLPSAGSEPGLANDSNPSRQDGQHGGPGTHRQTLQAQGSHDRNNKDGKATDDGPDLPKSNSGKVSRDYKEGEDDALLSAIEHELLDLFSDSYCNKHLIYSIVELVLVKLIPEMGEHSVTELMNERGVSWSTASITTANG
ncbi:PXA domain protein [Trichophyton mentagrophytes]|uniref:PXA domain-containing protein n=1 Tax=Trichophyton interdigitale TaxID=101480 RepID=A0A9P4YJ59_9EURO|nr:PXA domain-containing protein [Trichophyton interdigitale]KAF3899574.1 PXA domain-containing protein [Trichophyton interdigitale]KAG8209871.1 PXA domain-containing protein [Trichophyton interdigitale]GBF63913.1 PXA domain protein [Trichophyton mentagrophytes]